MKEFLLWLFWITLITLIFAFWLNNGNLSYDKFINAYVYTCSFAFFLFIIWKNDGIEQLYKEKEDKENYILGIKNEIKKLNDTITKNIEHNNIDNENDALYSLIEEIREKVTILNKEIDFQRKKAILYKVEFDNKIRIFEHNYKNRENELNENSVQIGLFYNDITDNLKESMLYIASYIADLDTVEYDFSEHYLLHKPRPAITEALRIADLKKETKNYIIQYKMMKYEYDYLMSLFPELENYIDSIDESITTVSELKDNYDYVKSWVSKEEYEQLSENERNQLALTRYIESRKKNKWQIGRDYEMYIGHIYEKNGYRVFYTGIQDRLCDKGRDLIAKNNDETLIIQCKNWSKDKIIHEKHICQLFGTTIQYQIEHKCKARGVFITSTSLSDVALTFANYLGIEIQQNVAFQEFPRIKCNIGKNNEKIYHLPFDQQYDKTIIDKKDECFCSTVEEATKKGFRRAKKYFVN